MLEEIREEFKRLMALYESEKSQRLRADSELEQSRRENEDLRKRIIDLERQVDNHRLTEAFEVSSGDKGPAREKIEGLIREMDRCIALLEK